MNKYNSDFPVFIALKCRGEGGIVDLDGSAAPENRRGRRKEKNESPRSRKGEVKYGTQFDGFFCCFWCLLWPMLYLPPDGFLS